MRVDMQEALEKFKGHMALHKKSFEAISEYLTAEEKCLYVNSTVAKITTNLGSKSKTEKLPGVLCLTDKQIIFAYGALMSHKMYTTNLDNVLMMDIGGDGFSGGHLEVSTQMRQFDFLIKYKKEMIREVQLVFDEAIANAKNADAKEGSTVSFADKIKQIAELHERGLLTDNEYVVKKKQLLELM
ncbi:MAG: SHOCT domain-containing protein [Lactobacillaceae bacterium]|jgi:hypothetical protein|nr:SHOCT domain-containing protein [Lactobacillaceae bacterium]